MSVMMIDNEKYQLIYTWLHTAIEHDYSGFRKVFRLQYADFMDNSNSLSFRQANNVSTDYIIENILPEAILLEHILPEFMKVLFSANLESWNNRYNEKETAEFEPIIPPKENIVIISHDPYHYLCLANGVYKVIKLLHCIKYQIEGSWEYEKELDNLINVLAVMAIRQDERYNDADWG